ncbi:DUF3592 domain-containing protein [Legionella nagasakiensis]|uniref:DUF3592 domain-containing protein n=1 Tax=Legionella nagasakiensis TaxID=535290 RepID=UPI001054EAB7|nr:DUF3592 domain-containing protein [Legionella nagasakiensis]
MLAQYISWQNALDLGWLLFLLLILGYFWSMRREIRQAQDWPKTKGRITYCKWTIEGHRLWPKIEYIYQVGERDFIGEHVFLDTSHHDPNSKYARHIAYKVAKAYQKDETIDVHYNPDKPEQAVLDTCIPGKLNFILVLIFAFIVLHLVLVGIRVSS